jgi:uncharacterized protein (TIGR02588 family)
MREARDKPGQESGRDDAAKRRLEAIAAAIGAALALATLGVIVWDGVRKGQTGALIIVEAEAVTPYQGGYALQVVARNTGDETAAGVTIVGDLMRGEQVVETGEITFDYVASRSQRRGGVFFSQNPADFDVELRATGYADP